MAVQLSISVDNQTQTLTSGAGSDILDVYLNGSHPSTTRYLQIDLVRNCCSSGTTTYLFYPRYTFSLTNESDGAYVPGGATANDRVANFTLNGIDVTYISKVEVWTNADAPTTTTFVYKEYTGAQITTTGFNIYYLENDVTATYPIRITTIDGFVYLLDVEYDWANTPIDSTTTTVTINTYPDLPTGPVVDFVGNDIEFDVADWGLTTDDNVFLDGIYQYNLTQVETGANIIETVNKFFNIKLQCLVTAYLANNPTDALIGVLFAALELSDTCSLSVSQKCSLYEKVIRELVLANQVKLNSPLGCNCGCS